MLVAGKDGHSKTIRIDLLPGARIGLTKRSGKATVIAVPGPQGGSGLDPGDRASDESRYEKLLQSVYDATLIVDIEGAIADVNRRAVGFLQYSRDELRGMSVFDVVSGADSDLITTLCENLQDERYTLLQAHCRRKDGSFFPSEIAVSKIDLDGLYLTFFVRDITVRRHAEEMLLTEHSAIHNSGNGIAVADLASRLEYVNPAVGHMWECDEDELVGISVRDLFADAGEADRVIDNVRTRQEAWSGEMTAERKDGTSFDVQVSSACNRSTDGELVGFVFSFVDISDRKRAEAAEMESARRRVMLESLGAACHHLSQPATVLLANLEIVENELGSAGEKIKNAVRQSLESVDQMGKILRKLNAVNEYRTTVYLEKKSGRGGDSEESRILQI